MTEHTIGTPSRGVEGKVVIVTGATRGIGRGLARHFGWRGASLVITGRKQERVDRTVAELTDAGVPVLGEVFDVADRDAAHAMVARTVAHFGRVDGLVNNAQSFISAKPLETVTAEDMDLLHRTGPLGTLWCMQAVFPYMRDQGFGRIVNTSTAVGIRGGAGYGPYGSSNEAIRALTRTAAREWGRYGIVVNCHCPAAAGHRNPPEPDDIRFDQWQSMYATHPMGRDGDPEEDIAPIIEFLLSDDCRWLTGETLMSDGGGLMRA
jgi:2-hydroxycyclohexanecarboxyl-CoA dehydrogenase